jgi:peroxiredoxin
MRTTIQLLVLSLLFEGCSSGRHFTINANIKGPDSNTFILEYREIGEYAPIDTAILENGRFRMEGSVKNPVLVRLVSKNTGNRLQFYIENSRIKINGELADLENANVSGSITQAKLNSFINSGKPLKERSLELINEYELASNTSDTARMAQIMQEAKLIRVKQKSLLKEFVVKYPGSFAAPELIRGFSSEMEADELEAVINVLDTTVSSSPVIKGLRERIRILKSVAIGQKAPDFKAKDANGEPFSLSAKAGYKLLLVCFWASWNNQSRQENPNLVKIYNQFRQKGLEIISVSLDYRSSEWKKAIAVDELSWINVSDLQYTNSYPAKLYGISSMPSNFLLSETGTIIAKNLMGKDLFNAVNELLVEKK